jgi:hypothetical protein
VDRDAISQLSDHDLMLALDSASAKERATKAALLADLGEIDARELYLAAGYPSMLAYCVGEFGMCDEETPGLITAARIARRFPVIFEALAEGRLHNEAVILLAPHLTPETVDELIVLATHKGETEIRRLLAERFPGPEDTA